MGKLIMDDKKNYHEEQNKLNIIKMRNVLSELPSFCKQFFRGIENNTSARTRLAYAYDLRVFFEYMHKNNSYCSKMRLMKGVNLVNWLLSAVFIIIFFKWSL